MKVRYLNGERLKDMLTAGSVKLIEQKDYLNSINVFPVPDGDTGTNMAGTMEYIISDLANKNYKDIGSLSHAAAQSALMGAKGNSGAILAQFFNGIAHELKDCIRINASQFGKALLNAASHTYSAVSNPKEGTILTIIKEWAREAEFWSNRTDDITTIHEKALIKAKIALKNTRNQLSVLKKAGVIDAGAMGFVNFLEGISHVFSPEKFSDIYRKKIDSIKKKAVAVKEKKIEFKGNYRYCTECLISSNETQIKPLRETLLKMGDSLIIADGSGLIKIHIHTNKPQSIFKIAGKYGTLEKTKIDDMKAQAHSVPAGKSIRSCAIVADSACDLPQEIIQRYGIQIVPTAVHVAGKNYLDKVEISIDDFYSILEKNPDIEAGTSMPAVGEFIKVFELLSEYYSSIIYIGVSEVTSGTISSGRKAAEMVCKRKPDLKIDIINSKNGTAVLGLIVEKAAQMAEKGLSRKSIIFKVKTIVENTSLVAVLPSLHRLVKGGRLSAKRAAVLNCLRLRPIISNSREGYIKAAGLFFGKKRALKILFRIMKKKSLAFKNPEFVIAHSACERKAKKLKQLLKQHCKTKKQIRICKIGPALTAHAGLGVLVGGVTGEKDD
jgi:hypothetical protein